MKLTLLEQFSDTSGGRLAVLAIVDHHDNVEAITDVLNSEQGSRNQVLTRISALCVSTVRGHPLPKEICNSLNDGLREIKPGKMRIVFFTDEVANIKINNKIYRQAIVFTSHFRKTTSRTPSNEIIKALKLKSQYYTDKENEELTFLTLSNGGE